MWFAFIISIMNADHIMNSSRNSLDEVNDQFNQELLKQIAGTLPKGHIYRLGYPIQGKSLYLNKQKIQALIDQQRINLADVAYLDLNLVESLLETFVNPLQR